MSYFLTKEQLKESAYYCAAGTDFQPIVRLGDVVKDFIYVSVEISKEELLKELIKFIKDINEQLANSKLTLCDYNDISINDIEHPVNNRLLANRPTYLNDEDYQNYIRTFKYYYQKTDDFYILINLKLDIGGLSRQVRLFYLCGEALATYDAIFLKQEIAPKIFISVQTGMIEDPSKFSNRLFEISKNKPKVWLRGSWASGDETRFGYPKEKNKNSVGIFNEKIGEFRSWKAYSKDNINLNYRIVKAYGEESKWEIKTKKNIIIRNGLKINKLLKGFDRESMFKNYDIVKENFPLTKIVDLESEAQNLHSKNTNLTTVKICIVPGGYEFYEFIMSEFSDNFIKNENFDINIDIFYCNKLDFYRDF